jgi:8-oxo-dGTP pyrophosphatase MutT (NUDIX family)
MSEWQCKNSQKVFHCRVFSVRCDENASPITGKSAEFYIIEPTNWVNIIAITADREVVLIDQYRFGSRTVTREIPGGMIDEGESPETAARRELREETGFEADQWQLIGVNEPNPALQNNRCYTFLAQPARRVGAPRLDDNEAIETRLHPIDGVPEMIARGEITHALVIAAFYFYNLFLTGKAAGIRGRGSGIREE